MANDPPMNNEPNLLHLFFYMAIMRVLWGCFCGDKLLNEIFRLYESKPKLTNRLK